MAKKRLAEFLREEAHKSLDLDSSAASETNDTGEKQPSELKSSAAKVETGQTTTVAKQSTPAKAQTDAPSEQSPSAKQTTASSKDSQNGRSPQPSTKPSTQTSAKSRSARKPPNSTPQEEPAMTPVQPPETNSVDAAEHPADYSTDDTAVNEAKSSSGITQTQLHEAIAELKSTLLESKVREETLQHQVEMLQNELVEQRELAQQFQTKQDKTSQLEKELEEARKVILQLSELNQKLVTTAQPAKAQPLQEFPSHSPAKSVPETPSNPPAKSALPKPLPTPPDPLQLLEPTPQRTPPAPVPPHQSVTSQMELRKVLKHPVTPTIPPATLSNEEIGWVD